MGPTSFLTMVYNNHVIFLLSQSVLHRMLLLPGGPFIQQTPNKPHPSPVCLYPEALAK